MISLRQACLPTGRLRLTNEISKCKIIKEKSNPLCILLKNNSSRYNFLSKITRTDVALSLNSQNAQRVKVINL